MTISNSTGLTRRGLLGAFAASMVVAAPTASNAFGILRGAGDVRRISMYSGRTGESLDTIYWVEGDYIKEALKEINHFMRDWRTDQAISIDARTIDIAAASLRLMDVSEPYMLLSGYRSPQTNAMLRSQVARRGEEFAAHAGPGRRPAAAFAQRRADVQGGKCLQRRWRRQILALELRAHGLRSDPHLGRLRTP